MHHSQKELMQIISHSSYSKGSSKELAAIVRYLFESPQDLGNKFSEISKKPKNYGDHGIDLSLLSKFYDNVDSLKLSQQIGTALIKTFEYFECQGKLKQFLNKRERVRFFFIVAMWDKLYTLKQNNLLLLKFVNLITYMGIYKNILSDWFDDMGTDHLKLIITQLSVILQCQFHKLQPQNVPPQILSKINLNIDNICLFLQILYESNKRRSRIKKQKFSKPNMGEYFRPIDTFKLYLKKTKPLNFTRFPFILDLDYKYKLLQIQSIFEQKTNIHKNMQNGFQNLLSGMVQLDVNGNFSLQGIIFLQFQINRNNILDDSMEKLGKIKTNLKSPLKIQFIGEEGSDEGGVKNEYFQLLTKQIFNPYLDMFLPKNSGRVYWFNGFSYQPPIRFEFVGMLFGLAIYNSVHLQVRFPRLLYKKLLTKNIEETEETIQLEDLKEIQPQVYQSLKQIQESSESLDDLELYFTIQLQNFGQKITEQLVEDGLMIKLSQDNKNQYVIMYVQHLLNKHIEKQFQAFRRGFLRVVDTQLIKMFQTEDLETIICGIQVIDFKELQATTNYQGYTKTSPVIKNLWQILNGLSLDDKKAFLVFCTGSDRVPLEGLKSLNFLIQKHANSEHFPSAHTCFNVLLLPQYETKQKLKKNIEFILKNNQGFGLI